MKNNKIKYNSVFFKYGYQIPITKLSDKEKLECCPKIILNGWWWKKYFKKYKNISEVMNDIQQYDWMHGGYENSIEVLHKLFNMTIDQIILSRFPPFTCKK